MQDNILLKLLEILFEEGRIPERLVEDEQIRMDFIELKKKGVATEMAKLDLADKYSRSFAAIEDVLYRKSKRFKKGR
jgi:hypothetical protein